MTSERIAVISDIHGNLTALEAVIADLRRQSPDLVFHLGDLAANGYRPAEALDRIRELGWDGVLGNTDEMLWRPDLLSDVAGRAPGRSALRRVLFEEIAPRTAELIGPGRLAWLKNLPTNRRVANISLIHATAADLWHAPSAQAADEEIHAAFDSLGTPIVVYGHIHHAYIRAVGQRTVANTGAVGISYDGDPRASYILVDEGKLQVRRVEYDVEEEVRGLLSSGYPRADWLAKMIRTGRYIPPD